MTLKGTNAWSEPALVAATQFQELHAVPMEHWQAGAAATLLSFAWTGYTQLSAIKFPSKWVTEVNI